MLGEDMAAYDDFAWFYNRYWNEEFHALAFPILERIWLPRVPPAAASWTSVAAPAIWRACFWSGVTTSPDSMFRNR